MSLLEKEPARRPASAIVARQTVERIERRLLASSGTNAAHPVQRGDDEPSQPSQPSAKVRARVPITGSEPAYTPTPVQDPPPPPRARRSARSIKDEAPPDTSLRPTAPALMQRPARPTVLVRDEDDDEELSLGASRFRGRENEPPEESAAPTAQEMQPLTKQPGSRGPAIAAGVVTIALVCVGLAWKLSTPEPEVIPETPLEKPLEEPRKAAPIPQPTPEVEEAAKPDPEPLPPEPAVVAPPPSTAPVRPSKGVAAPAVNIEAMITALEERCLLELTEQKQRMALDDLRELRGDVKNVPPDEARRQVKDFEAHWLKGSKK
jgi:hypothetical protein